MRTLLHICCGPCALQAVEPLRNEGIEVFGFFYNPNIHPYREYLLRLEAVKVVAERWGFKVIYQDRYELEAFLQSVVFREKDRCTICYHLRLDACARAAKQGRFDSFTSTLLGSTHQDHELIGEVGRAVGKTYGIPFLFKDFRGGKTLSREVSAQWGIYRQQYCGCIYSEKERFFQSKTRRDKKGSEKGKTT